ncbi:ABC transporter permease [Carnimonas nigrificans]|uniref:ABC transporter permease n=1 Tax=Carnimonas nigrificans TaxID=64323 RepID=UPI000472209A|nr:ABC transporter permease [Carnimonas nigrificans]
MSDITESDLRKPRGSLKVTWDVWSALVLREFTSRTTADRMGWFWMLFEPLATIAVMMFVREYLRHSMRHVVGAEFVPWLIVGLMCFYIFRECMTTPIAAISSSKSMFSYRQVQPIDPVIARCVVGGMLRGFIFLVIISFSMMIGALDFPYDPLLVINNLLAVWMLGSSLGVLFAVLAALVPEIGRVVRLLSMPLLFLSGTIFPIENFPLYIKVYMSWNPLLIAIEKVRLGFFQYYHTLNDLSDIYLWSTIIMILTLALLMHVRFSTRLKMM